MYQYCKTIWIGSLKVGISNVAHFSFGIFHFLYFGLRLHKEATQWRIQGGQGS